MGALERSRHARLICISTSLTTLFLFLFFFGSFQNVTKQPCRYIYKPKKKWSSCIYLTVKKPVLFGIDFLHFFFFFLFKIYSPYFFLIKRFDYRNSCFSLTGKSTSHWFLFFFLSLSSHWNDNSKIKKRGKEKWLKLLNDTVSTPLSYVCVIR